MEKVNRYWYCLLPIAWALKIVKQRNRMDMHCIGTWSAISFWGCTAEVEQESTFQNWIKKLKLLKYFIICFWTLTHQSIFFFWMLSIYGMLYFVELPVFILLVLKIMLMLHILFCKYLSLLDKKKNTLIYKQEL